MHTVCKLTNIYMYLKVGVDTSAFKYYMLYADTDLFMQVYILRVSVYVYIYAHTSVCVL